MSEHNDYLKDISYIIEAAIRKEGLKGAIRLLETLDRGSFEVYDQYKNQYVQSNSSEAKMESSTKIENIALTEMKTPGEASIYRESARNLVAQDMAEHPLTEVRPISNEETEDIVSVEESLKSEGPVLKRTVNNPWSDIETVSPGQLKL